MNTKTLIRLSLISASLSLASVQAQAEGYKYPPIELPPEPEHMMELVEEAIESHAITLIVDGGQVSEIIATPCSGCTPKTLRPGQTLILESPHARLSVQQAQSLNGKPGTVYYNIKTGKASRVLFY